jgi:hypothetical protein
MTTPTPPPYPPNLPRKPRFWTPPKLVAAAVLCAVITGGIFIATRSQGGDNSTTVGTSESTDYPTTDPGTDSVAACAGRWNSLNDNKQNIGALATVGETGENPTAYVTIGSSSLFPDRCMITLANPATMSAWQYIEDPGSGWSGNPSWGGTASQLNPSVTSWNASMKADGTINVL